MDLETIQSRICRRAGRGLTALLCAALVVPGGSSAWLVGQESQTPAAAEAQKIPNDQLDSLVAPIALYPDQLLAQVLAASTYPLEIVQLQQWLGQHKDLKDKALTDAVMKQDWDPSVQGLASLPDAVKLLADDIKWTTDLGNAFLAQQADVMDAVQRMRKKAKDNGNLKTTEQQKVETKVVEEKTVIVVQQSNPQVVYVPTYNPTVVYGPPVYPYPPIAYPPPGYYAAGAAISFGVGMMVGAAINGGWGYNCGWGGNNTVVINNNNNFVNNSNRQNVRTGGTANVGSGNNTWQHNPQHRGGAPYSDRSTANKYGGSARGDSVAARQANASRNTAQGGRTQAGATNRNTGGRTGSSTGVSDRSSNRSGAGGGDRVGNRSVSPSASTRDSSAFGGASSRTSGSAARTSSSRGSSSMSGSRGGGGRRR